MNTRQDIYAFSSYFANRSVFTTDEIVSYFQAQDSEINRNTTQISILIVYKEKIKKNIYDSKKKSIRKVVEKINLASDKMTRVLNKYENM